MKFEIKTGVIFYIFNNDINWYSSHRQQQESTGQEITTVIGAQAGTNIYGGEGNSSDFEKRLYHKSVQKHFNILAMSRTLPVRAG